MLLIKSNHKRFYDLIRIYEYLNEVKQKICVSKPGANLSAMPTFGVFPKKLLYVTITERLFKKTKALSVIFFKESEVKF